MDVSHRVNRKAYGLLAALAVVAAALGSGCVFTDLMAYFLVPFVDSQVPPKCKEITASKQEVTVAVATTFAGLEQRPDYQGVDLELSASLVTAMKKRFEANGNKVKFVSPGKVHTYLSQATHEPDMHDLGKRFHADFVIALEIQSIDFRMARSRDLLQGNTRVAVTVLDVRKPRRESKILDEEFQCLYPRDTPMSVGADGRGAGQFRGAFLNQVGVELSRWFAATAAEETRFGERSPNWQ